MGRHRSGLYYRNILTIVREACTINVLLALALALASVIRQIISDAPNCGINGTVRLKNNCLNTNIYSYLETSGDQSSTPYLNVVHFFQHKSRL